MTVCTRSRIQLAIIAVLLLVIAAMAYKFVIAGATQKAPDGRVAILLAPAERALMLREMRDFVGGLQLVADRWRGMTCRAWQRPRARWVPRAVTTCRWA